MNDTTTTVVSETNECFLSDDEIKNSYNLGLHIASIFVLLVVSFVGASISVASARIKYLHINPIIINTGKFFGSGYVIIYTLKDEYLRYKIFLFFYYYRVVLATGFIHILPDAMETLSDSCLPDSWTVYGAYGGLFAMLAALGMQLIEFLAHQRFRSSRLKHSHVTAHIEVKECPKNEQINDTMDESRPKTPVVNDMVQTICVENICEEQERPKKKKRANIIVVENENVEQENNKTEELNQTEPHNSSNGRSKKNKVINEEVNNPEMTEPEKPKAKPKKRRHVHHQHHQSENIEHIHEHTHGFEHNHTHGSEHNHTHGSEHNHTHGSEHNHPQDCVAVDIVKVEPMD